MVSDDDLRTLEELAARAGAHWRVCDDVLECGTAGAFHLLREQADGTTRAVSASLDVLEEDRTLMVYLAAAANLAPLLVAEIRELRAGTTGSPQPPNSGDVLR
ncbi:MAG TPA: hypothetical protein VNL71_06580 [Chloroflexota bacterium]|nr:hypothetical protein [Chloroflexota bacterium]